MQKTIEKATVWKRLVFGSLWKKNKAQILAYIAVLSAFNVIINEYASFTTGVAQFSFSSVCAMLTGIIIGPFLGFAATFVGDLLAFVIKPPAFPYSPWIGIATGMFALIMGLAFHVVPGKGKFWCYVKLSVACLLTFFVATVGITSIYLHGVMSPTVPYWRFVTARLFVQGQIWNSLANYALFFIALPVLARIKQLGIRIE